MNEPSKYVRVSATINGRNVSAEIEARRSLADYLREDLHLTGTHLGCEHGACGACTVLIDGALARSCLTLAAQVHGCEVVTVEGLGSEGALHPIQAAFKQHHALQCGFCTPGFLVSCAALLKENPEPTEPEIRSWLSGNICRCTGYQFIVDAVLTASAVLRGRQQAVTADGM